MPIFIEYVLDRGITWIFLTFNFKILTELNFVLHGFFIFLVGIKSVWYFFVAEQTGSSNIVKNNLRGWGLSSLFNTEEQSGNTHKL